MAASSNTPEQQFKLLASLSSEAFVQQYEKHVSRVSGKTCSPYGGARASRSKRPRAAEAQKLSPLSPRARDAAADADTRPTPPSFPKQPQPTKQPDLKDTLQACTRAQLTPFADGVLAQVQRALQTLHGGADDEDEEAANASETPLHALRVAAALSSELLRATVAAEATPLPALRTTVLLLHDHALLELGERADVQDAVASLCCAWWRAAAPDRERLLSQALPYLLIRALASGKPLHVRACNDMREGLELLDYDDEDIADLRRLLLHAARSPHFLSRQEGRSFLATVLTLHPLIVREFTQVVRSMAASGRRQVLDAYGDVLLRGWRAAQGACLHEIETTLIQDGLALAALRASTPALAASLRQILSHLHNAKRFGAASAGATDALLVRAYEPILFRDLDAANGAVRRNALRLLLDCFPLADPEAPDEDGDALMRRQFAALSAALADECPSVRAVAAVGTGAVLDRYWEMVPTATCAVYVGRLASELAFDSASPAVRAAAVQGLGCLVDNVRAQPVLRAALPRLAPLTQDAAPQVRSALAALLLRATTSRELRFWDVVPLERLLDALVAEAGGGNGGIAQGGGVGDGGGEQQSQPQQPQLTEAGALLFRVLAPSYVPPTGTSAEGEAPARVAALLRRHPAAGQTLCRLLAASLELGGAAGAVAAGSGGGAGACGLSVPAPLEAVVALARALTKHLLATPPEGWEGLVAAAGASPPRKQAKAAGGRGKAAASAAAAKATAGHKRRKQPAAGKKKKGDDDDDGQQQQNEEEQEVDVLSPPAEETPAAWAAILGGLAELCSGLGALALGGEVAGAEDVTGALPASLEQDSSSKAGKGKGGGKAGKASGSGSNSDDSDGPLQRLLAMAPTQGARRAVWRIAAALPWTPAAASLRADALARVASGEQLPASGAAAAAGAAGSGIGGEEAASAAALAALSGPQSGAKLAAMLCAAAGVPWEPTAFDPPEEEEEEEEKAQDDAGAGADEASCRACLKSKPDTTLLLCDGCDAAYHTACLEEPLPGIPRGDWLCPDCTIDVQTHGSRLGAEGALAHVSLLLSGGGGGGAGRALLRRSGALRRLLPAAEAAAGEASEVAERALKRLARNAAGGSGKDEGEDEDEAGALARAAAALDGAALWARAGLHSLVAAGGTGGDDAEAAVREAASAVLGAAECGASTVKALAAWVEAAGSAGAAGDEGEEGEEEAAPAPAPPPARGRRPREAAAKAETEAEAATTTTKNTKSTARLAALSALARWLGLLGDALRLRGFGEPLSPGPAAVVAASGRAALAALRLGARREGGAWRAHREAVGRALAADAALLKLLLAAEGTGRQALAGAAAAATASSSSSSAFGESGAWAAELLEALAVKPLAPLAPTLSRDVNAIVALLLEEEQARQRRRDEAEEAEEEDEAAAGNDGNDNDNAAPSWVRALASAAASALLAAVQKQQQGRADGADEEEDGENADPAAVTAATTATAPRTVALPPVVVAALAAAGGGGARRAAPATGGALAQAAAQAALDAGRRGDWAGAAGALRLAGVAAPGGAGGNARRADALRGLRTDALGAASSSDKAGSSAAALLAAAEVDLLVRGSAAGAAQ
jgi:hypothetical protein